MKKRIASLIAGTLMSAFVACSGAAWRSTEDVINVGACTLDRLIAEERQRGHTQTADRLELLAREVPADGGAP